MTKQEQAEEAEAKAYEASEEAETLQTTEAYTAAAKANFEAAKAHREHAETGAQEAAGNAAEYADSPEEAATGCEIEGYRFEALAAKQAEQAETERLAAARAWSEMYDANETEARLLADFYGETEQAEQEADRVSSLAADASDRASDVSTKEAHFLAAQAQDRAAHANSLAAIAHQAHADAGGKDAAGRAAEYADSPMQAAEACGTEITRFEVMATYHRKEAAKLAL